MIKELSVNNYVVEVDFEVVPCKEYGESYYAVELNHYTVFDEELNEIDLKNASSATKDEVEEAVDNFLDGGGAVDAYLGKDDRDYDVRVDRMLEDK